MPRRKFTDKPKEPVPPLSEKTLEELVMIPHKGLLFWVYPPNEEFDYWHYKNGFKAWEDCELGSKIHLIVALISLAVSIIAVYVSSH